jgi:hypothetical protein
VIGSTVFSFPLFRWKEKAVSQCKYICCGFWLRDGQAQQADPEQRKANGDWQANRQHNILLSSNELIGEEMLFKWRQ